ncbi:MAG: hypothetical protein QM660_15715 [Dysgonomonas sp.]
MKKNHLSKARIINGILKRNQRCNDFIMQNKFKQLLVIISLFLFTIQNQAQEYYSDTFSEIESMLVNTSSLEFKKAVFLTESAYLEGQLDEEIFNNMILFYTSICQSIAKSGNIEYTEHDKETAMAQCATFLFMTDSIPIFIDKEKVTSTPFLYNHSDFAGQKNWSSMFVSTLIHTNKGNCHSLPYLYKIIMDRLGYESHLALAPNHMYIKANNKKVGWYNIELTCSDFPTDAWYAASGYIHTDAIRNGIYMRALSDKEAVAMTLVDLAQGYQAKFGIEDGSFIIKCCDAALKHFPKYINAMLLKAEILTELYRESNSEELFSQMTELYTHIHELGYRKMPQQMYTNWMNSLSVEDHNQGIKAILNPKTKLD